MWLCQPVCIAPRGIKSPSHHHFYRWYQLLHSQSWLVYDTVLPTLFQDDPVSIATRHPFIYIHLPYATQMINIPIYDLVAFIFHSDTINIPFRYHKYTINMPHIFQTYSWIFLVGFFTAKRHHGRWSLCDRAAGNRWCPAAQWPPSHRRTWKFHPWVFSGGTHGKIMRKHRKNMGLSRG